MHRLRLRLDAPEGPVSFAFFVRALQRSLYLLEDVDRVVSGGRHGGVGWQVVDLAMNSPSPVAVLSGYPRTAVGDERAVERVGAGFIAVLDTAEGGEALPPHVSDVGLRHLRLLSSDLERDGASYLAATYVERDQSARISPQAAHNVKRLTVPRSKAIGSVVGRLEVVSLHEGYRFHVYDGVTQRAVRCVFAADELEQVKAALGRRVSVAGIVRRNDKGQPLRVEQPRLTILPREDDLPSTSDLIAVDRDFTGDLPTDEYVRRLRDA